MHLLIKVRMCKSYINLSTHLRSKTNKYNAIERESGKNCSFGKYAPNVVSANVSCWPAVKRTDEGTMILICLGFVFTPVYS